MRTECTLTLDSRPMHAILSVYVEGLSRDQATTTIPASARWDIALSHNLNVVYVFKSGRGDSNPRRPAWENTFGNQPFLAQNLCCEMV